MVKTKAPRFSESMRTSKHTNITLGSGDKINPTIPPRYREILDELCEHRGVNASELIRALLLEESRRVEKSAQGRK